MMFPPRLLTVEKFKKCRPLKNGAMQGSEKIQGARCIRKYISGLDFFADAADCHFWSGLPPHPGVDGKPINLYSIPIQETAKG